MTSKSRSELKRYFVKNAIPTESNFAELIDSPLNQVDDGVFRQGSGEPLSVVAATGDQKRTLQLYATFPAPKPDWLINLNPKAVEAPNAPTPGFGIVDGAGNTRLLIDARDGRLSVAGNVAYGGQLNKLDVADSFSAVVRVADFSMGHSTRRGTPGRALVDATTDLMINHSRDWPQVTVHSPLSVAGTLTVNGASTTIGILQATANGPSVRAVGVDHTYIEMYPQKIDSAKPRNGRMAWIGYGNTNVTDLSIASEGGDLRLDSANVIATSTLSAWGPIVPAAGNSDRFGIQFPANPGGGGLDAAWIRYYNRAGEDCTLELGTSNDPQDHISLMPSGNVGIGTRGPERMLDVNGDVRAAGEVQSTSLNAFRMIGGNYGAFWRNDGTDTYLLLTNASDPYGSWNAFRPFRVHNADGDVTLSKTFVQGDLTAAGAVFAGNSDLYFTKTDHNYTAIGDTPGYAAIENTASHDALMILGRSNALVPGAAPARARVVKLWDVLEINGSLTMNGGPIVPTAGNSESAGIVFPKDPAGGGGDRAWLRYYARSNEDMTLELGTSDNPQDHIALMPKGNVGVGTTTPNAKLSVVAAGAQELAGVAQSAAFRVAAGTLGTGADSMLKLASIGFNSGNNSSLGIRAHRLADGNNWTSAGIHLCLDVDNATNPSQTSILLHPAGRVQIEGSLRVTGTAEKPGGGPWSNISDARLKTNVKQIDGALSRLLALRGVSFDWRDPERGAASPRFDMGMIAQEVQQVFPEWVETGPDGYLRLSIWGFEALVIEALRELHDVLLTRRPEVTGPLQPS